jgi:hypothetical protein
MVHREKSRGITAVWGEESLIASLAAFLESLSLALLMYHPTIDAAQQESNRHSSRIAAFPAAKPRSITPSLARLPTYDRFVAASSIFMPVLKASGVIRFL